MKKEFRRMVATKKFRLEYYVTKSNIDVEGVSVVSYGIEIVKKQRKNGIISTESKVINNICISEHQVHKLLDMLADNLVTPITFKDIVEDMVAEQKINSPKEQILLDAFVAS